MAICTFSLWPRAVAAIAVLLASARLLLGDPLEQGPKDAKPSGLLAGTAKADITPPVGIPQQNWGSATHVEAVGIDPMGMFVRALVLCDGEQKFALVDVDALSGTYEEATRRASLKTGIPAAQIRIGNSHTHAGPQLRRDKGPPGVDTSQYQEIFERYRAARDDKIAGVIVEANSRLRPVHAHGMVGRGSININRRFRARGDRPAAVGLNAEGFVDRELIVIRIDDAEGNPFAVLVNFPCHGTVLGYENKYVSPDWIGSMRDTVETSLPGSTCLFFQGAAGDQGPMEGFSGDLHVARRLGAILGHEAAALALRIETVRREPRFEGFVQSTALQAKQPWRVQGPRDATLRFARKLVELPRRQYTAEEIANMARRLATADEEVRQAKQTGDSWQQYQAAARQRRYADLLRQRKQPPDPTPLRHEISVLAIGEMALVMTCGEPFAEIGAAVKRASPFPVTMFCAYGAGVGSGYIPVKSEYPFGGYEVEGTPFAPDAAAKLIEESIALLKSLETGGGAQRNGP